MAKSANGAYAGEAEMPNGVSVSVAYLNRAKLLETFGYQPPGHPARKRIGWYWSPRHVTSKVEGPFTSSRLAMQNAIKRNGGDHGR